MQINIGISLTGTIRVGAAGPTVLSYPISDTLDDVYEIWASDVFSSLGTFGVRIGPNTTNDYYAGLRFRSIAVDHGATIASATLTMAGLQSQAGTTWGTWQGIDEDDAPLWATTKPTDAASLTTANVAVDATGVFDVTDIVQEIVNRAGWASGNSLAFVGLGAGSDGMIRFWDYEHNPSLTSNFTTLSITLG